MCFYTMLQLQIIFLVRRTMTVNYSNSAASQLTATAAPFLEANSLISRYIIRIPGFVRFCIITVQVICSSCIYILLPDSIDMSRNPSYQCIGCTLQLIESENLMEYKVMNASANCNDCSMRLQRILVIWKKQNNKSCPSQSLRGQLMNSALQIQNET